MNEDFVPNERLFGGKARDFSSDGQKNDIPKSYKIRSYYPLELRVCGCD